MTAQPKPTAAWHGAGGTGPTPPDHSGALGRALDRLNAQPKPTAALTTAQVREMFASEAERCGFDGLAEFDRWLAEHSANVWDEGFEAGATWTPHSNGIPVDPPLNPYAEDV